MSALMWLILVVALCVAVAVAFTLVRRARRAGSVLAAHIEHGAKP